MDSLLNENDCEIKNENKTFENVNGRTHKSINQTINQSVIFDFLNLYLLCGKGLSRGIVVCPTSLIRNWEQEMKKLVFFVTRKNCSCSVQFEWHRKKGFITSHPAIDLQLERPALIDKV